MFLQSILTLSLLFILILSSLSALNLFLLFAHSHHVLILSVSPYCLSSLSHASYCQSSLCLYRLSLLTASLSDSSLYPFFPHALTLSLLSLLSARTLFVLSALTQSLLYVLIPSLLSVLTICLYCFSSLSFLTVSPFFLSQLCSFCLLSLCPYCLFFVSCFSAVLTRPLLTVLFDLTLFRDCSSLLCSVRFCLFHVGNPFFSPSINRF